MDDGYPIDAPRSAASASEPRREVVWGVVDQGLSSATNFGLSLLAARLLGASGLGVIYLGFATYLICLSFMRALVLEPMVIASAGDDKGRDEAARASTTLVLVIACAVALLTFVVGHLISGTIGRSLLVFAPWVAGALVQDLWRSLLFRDERGRGAAWNDGIWAIGMVVMLPFAIWFPSDWMLAATWGVGASAAAVIGFFQTRTRPLGLAAAYRWWTREARALGSWLAVQNAILTAGNQGLAFVIAAELGASDLGGIRVAEVAFAPMSLVGEAFALPGLPYISRSLSEGLAAARRAAWRIGWAAAGLVGAYLLVVAPAREQVLDLVFGSEFVQYAPLIIPVAVSQFMRAQSLGFGLLLKADRRVHAFVAAPAIGTAVSIVLVPVLGNAYGAAGAMWGLAARPAVTGVLSVWWGLLSSDIWRRGRPSALAPQEAT